jgi:photosystem I subunit 2
MTLNLQTPFPTFGGSTGGYAQLKLKKNMRSLGQVQKSKYLKCLLVVQQLCVMENLLYLARKEQCLALGTQLRTFKINNYKIYRIFPSGEVQYLHPKDGVFPEKSKSRSDCCEQS